MFLRLTFYLLVLLASLASAQQPQPAQPRCEDRLAVAQDARGLMEAQAIQYAAQWRAEQQTHAVTRKELDEAKAKLPKEITEILPSDAKGAN